ncbi:medium chain dehydrogenase/reductase family protein [Candidatus Pelagibacter sp.]|nr:medium chain dehydrogenase/reductase family protein [Candidatus Pelagibacter sp.]
MKKNFFKAAVLTKLNKKLKLVNLNFPKLLKGQVLIKILYSGICGSQVGEIKGIKGSDNHLPHLLGHEGTGVVFNIGPNVKKVKKGNKVIMHWKKSTGINSKTPTYNTMNREKINAGWVTTFNEYSVISENRLTKLPNGMNLKHGILYGCALTTSYGVVFNQSKLKKENAVLVYGSGSIGLGIICFAKIIGCKKIIAIDNNKKKLAIAKKMGANLIINSSKKNFKNINEDIKIFLSKKPDIIFENTGNSKVIEFCYNLISDKGKLMLIGVPNHKHKIKINTMSLHYGKKLIGSFGGNCKPHKDIDKIYKMFKKKKINHNNFIGKTYTLDQINLAIRNLKSMNGDAKPIIKMK